MNRAEKQGRHTILMTLQNVFFVLNYYWKYGKGLFIYRSILTVLNTIELFVTVNIAKWVMNFVMQNNIFAAMICIVVIGVFLVVTNFIAYHYSYMKDTLIDIDVQSAMYLELLNKIKRIDQKNFETMEFYDKYVRSVMDIELQPQRVLDTTFKFITSLLQVFTMGAVIGGIHPVYLLFGMTSAIIVMFIVNCINKCDYDEFLKNTTNARKMDYTKRLTYQREFSENLKLADGFVSFLSQKYIECTKDYKKNLLEYAKKKNFYARLMVTSNTLFGTVLPWMFLATSLYNRSITIADATVIISGMSNIPITLKSLFMEINQFKIQSLHINNIRDIFNFTTEIENEDGREVEETISEIALNNVTFSYAAENVIENICFSVKKGEKIAIVGMNGAGKTTIIKLLQHLYNVNEGSITLNGTDIRDYKISSYRKHIVSMQQNYQIYGYSIAENILLRKAESKDDYELVYDALKQVELYDKVMQMEQGVDTCITTEFEENGVYLSGGEQQRLALARIYAEDADIVIMDEPTSALDAINEDEVLKHMIRLFQDKIVIIVSHKLSLVNEVDHIYVINNHTICEHGKHSELMKQKGLYYEMYDKQAKRYVCVN